MSYRFSTIPYTEMQMTLEKILQLYKQNELILDPAYQRDSVAPKTWKKNFVPSWMSKICPSVLHFRKMKKGETAGLYEVIDGVQRITTLIEFLEDKFSCNPKDSIPYTGADEVLPINLSAVKYSEMLKLQNGDMLKDVLLKQCVFNVIVYNEIMTEEEAAEIFRTINSATTQNHQELRQATTLPLAQAVRLLARGITPNVNLGV